MNRTFRLLVLLLVAGAVAGCTAGIPGATADPSPTPAQLAAVPPVQQPPPTEAPTTAPPTATAPPSPTAEPTVPPAEPTFDIDTAPGFQTNSEPATGPQADRLPPPPDPGTGQSLIVPDPSTLESPLFGDDPNELQVALTFDAGADRGYAAEILDTLAAEGVKASFGMTGKWAEANPDLVQRMVDEGHMLFNHTWDHDSLTGANTDGVPQTAEQVAQQLIDTETVVRELTGYEMRPYFRPPYGDYSEEALAYLADNGYYITVWWTCDSFGWKGWTADQINDYCTQNLKNHEIILLHVGVGAAGDYASLPGMIASFRDQGYEFVTVEEMVQPD